MCVLTKKVNAALFYEIEISVGAIFFSSNFLVCRGIMHALWQDLQNLFNCSKIL